MMVWGPNCLIALTALLLISCGPVSVVGEKEEDSYSDSWFKIPLPPLLRGSQKYASKCQQVSYVGKEDFDIDTYIRRSWYIQKQVRYMLMHHILL